MVQAIESLLSPSCSR